MTIKRPQVDRIDGSARWTAYPQEPIPGSNSGARRAAVQNSGVERGKDGNQKFDGAASEPLAILKFDSAMGRSSIGNRGAEVRAVFCFRQSCCRGAAKSGCPLCAKSGHCRDLIQTTSGTIEPNPAIGNSNKMILRNVASLSFP